MSQNELQRVVALSAITKAWENHDDNGVVRLTMKEAQTISEVLSRIEAAHAVAPGGGEWPDYVMLRDTKLHDDQGGLGQRIFTTAGAGYEKIKYVRADLAAAPASEATGQCNLYRALPYGTNGWRYAVVRGSQTDFLTADFVDAGEASEYAAHRNALVDQRGDDSLPAASSAAGEHPHWGNLPDDFDDPANAEQEQAGGSERTAAEHEYTMTAFDYSRDPVGSRDWTLYWKGWQAALLRRAARVEVAAVEVLNTPYGISHRFDCRFYELPAGRYSITAAIAAGEGES